MTQQMLTEIETATAASRWPRNLPVEHREKEVPDKIAAILVDTVIQVGPLIDAICCRVGDWVDWRHYRPLPGISGGSRDDPGLVIRLALSEDIFGLRYGGYIEVCVLSEEKIIKAYGGYYDAYDQPKPVIDGSLQWHVVTHDNVGQALLVMHDRIMRKHMVCEESHGRLCLEQRGGTYGD